MTDKPSPYVSEILDTAFANAQAVVVIMAPEEEVKLREQYVKESDPEYEKGIAYQARPNVLFEAGLAWGRSVDRVILVEIGNLRPFSDLAGRHTIKLDNSTQKRQALASRLRMAGCEVDISGTDWHTEGDFSIQ